MKFHIISKVDQNEILISLTHTLINALFYKPALGSLATAKALPCEKTSVTCEGR